MTFHLSPYSTPLLFGFAQAWIYAILLFIRGRREERLSDFLLGLVLVGCAFNIWEYMLGFAGIDILWNRLEFFPRTLGYLFPVLCFFYLKSQFNAGFRFSWRDGWHALPFLIHTAYHVGVFAMGHAFVLHWKQTVQYPYGVEHIEFGIGIVIDLIYLYWSLQLYRQYLAWIKTQFSETETISFRWFRNFLIILAVTSLFSLIMTVLSWAFNLDYWQNWWDELAGVVLIYYVSIEGYAQRQANRKLTFRPDRARSEGNFQPTNETLNVQASESVLQSPEPALAEPQFSTTVDASLLTLPPEKQLAAELEPLKEKLLAYMTSEKPYLEPELSLADLARRLHTNPVLLSQVINAGAGKNFNDFVNEYRVEEFKRQVREPANAHLSFLGLALDCGFNSKATFNRAFKKFTGASPKEFAET
jgi:AraC-like DNA-binding protein